VLIYRYDIAFLPPETSDMIDDAIDGRLCPSYVDIPATARLYIVLALAHTAITRASPYRSCPPDTDYR